MKYSLLIFISFLFLFLFIDCSSKRKQDTQRQQGGAGEKRPPMRVDGFIVKTQTVFDNIDISGTIVANEATEIHPEVSGRITGIYFREGAYVGKGALLAKLNDEDLQAQKRKLEVQLKIAQQNESRSEQLLKIQGISRQDYELRLLEVNNIKADLAIINTNIAKTQIRAPFSGKLGLKEVSTGAYVSPTSVITTISQTSQLKIDFTVPEKYSNRIHLGQYVNFVTEGSDRAYTARVSATESSVAENTRSLKVRATVTGDQKGLTPGNFAKVRLSFKPDENAVVIPSQAVIPQARGKKVYTLQNGQAKFVDVTTGIRDSAMVQITSGLNAGDTVLVTGLLSLKPDAKVTINKIVNANDPVSSAQNTRQRNGNAEAGDSIKTK
ncbi:MAG: efflux RND transporter periplasmic adaptor subunit [Bacteroidota bacterium]|nr:efflux RND transporter periplasmic adaptor subunit [Bacteroidota bacterium]